MLYGTNHGNFMLDYHSGFNFCDLDVYCWARIRVFMVKHNLSKFLNEICPLGLIMWIIDIGCTTRLIMSFMCILHNLMDYEKFHLWPWEVGWINNINKWAYKEKYWTLSEIDYGGI